MNKPTDKELTILQILWQRGTATVREVHEAMNQNSEVGYTTTLKLMQIMNEKGIVSRTKRGKTHIYRAVLSEENTQQHLLDKLLNTAFKGSAAQMVMQLLDSEKTSKKELEEIRRFIREIDKDK